MFDGDRAIVCFGIVCSDCVCLCMFMCTSVYSFLGRRGAQEKIIAYFNYVTLIRPITIMLRCWAEGLDNLVFDSCDDIGQVYITSQLHWYRWQGPAHLGQQEWRECLDRAGIRLNGISAVEQSHDLAAFVFWLASRWGMILLTAAGSISGQGFPPQSSTRRSSNTLKQGCISNHFSTTNTHYLHKTLCRLQLAHFNRIMSGPTKRNSWYFSIHWRREKYQLNLFTFYM